MENPMQTARERNDNQPDNRSHPEAPAPRKPWQPLKVQILEIGQHTQSGGIPALFDDGIFFPMS